MTNERKVDLGTVIDSLYPEKWDISGSPDEPLDAIREALDAVKELIAADRAYDEAREDFCRDDVLLRDTSIRRANCLSRIGGES